MSKFNPGDHIEAIDRSRGFEEAIVLSTFTSQEKKTKGKEMYLLKILCGTATIPVSAEYNYQLATRKRIL